MVDALHLALLFALGATFLGCGDDDDPPPQTVRPTPADEAAPEDEREDEAQEEDEQPAPELANLLTAHGALVEVSSASGPRHAPEKMWDGDPTTAWCSRTADLETAYIRVRFDERVALHRLEAIPGYARDLDERDLFTENQRVVRASLAVDGRALEAAPFDTASRARQAFVAPQSPKTGRMFLIRFTELRPGTVERFREVCISELALLGVAPEEVRGASRVTVRSTSARAGTSAQGWSVADIDEAPAVAARGLTPATEGLRFDEEALNPLIRPGFRSAASIVHLHGYRNRRGDEVYYALVTHEPSEEWRAFQREAGALSRLERQIERAYQRCLDDDEEGGNHCEEETKPYYLGRVLHLARISAPAGAAPRLDQRIAIDESFDMYDGGYGWTLEMRDVDRDQKPELVVHYDAQGPSVCVSGPPYYEKLSVRDADHVGRGMSTLLATKWAAAQETMKAIYRFQDENDDGHPDLAVRRATYFPWICEELDDRGWPVGTRADELSFEDEGECTYRVSRTVYLYKPSIDDFAQSGTETALPEAASPMD